MPNFCRTQEVHKLADKVVSFPILREGFQNRFSPPSVETM